MSRSVYRTDIGSLRPVERRDDGTIVVDAYLTKCGVFPYRQQDGSTKFELRLPEDVFDSASMKSFEGRVVTNNHPPGMVDARTAREYAVGCLLGVPTRDGDHMRGRLSVYDEQTVGDMESGKLQVSNGYTCDTVETPGIHPIYGKYDAIQKNIRGNHVAIVDRARAGVTASARMDAERACGMMVLEPGTEIALGVDALSAACNSRAMANQPTARVEVIVKHDTDSSASAVVDPNDEANRNAKGLNNAHDAGGDAAAVVDPKKAKDPDADPDDLGDQPEHDSMYDDEGELTDVGAAKIAASSFGLPDKKRLPIHDPKAVKDSMKKFGGHEFDSADEKHGAFNRIKGKAQQFGINTAGFEKAHASKLDRDDRGVKDNQMTPTEIKALQEKADKAERRKEKLVAAKTKIDALEADMAKKDGEIAGLKKDLEAAKAAPKTDSTDDTAVQARLDARLELLDQARTTGATVTPKMSDVQIQLAVIKHVDGDDVPADKAKLPPYVEALYNSALKRAKKDADDTNKGATALDKARAAAAAPAAGHTDADDTDEDAAKARLRAYNSTAYARQETK